MLRILMTSVLLLNCFGCKDDSNPDYIFPKVYNLTDVEYFVQGCHNQIESKRL